MECISVSKHITQNRMFESARIALERQKYSVVAGWLSPVSDGYGKRGLVSAYHRIQMCQLATQSSNWISVSNWEAEKANWTPTAESVTYHARKAKIDFDADLKLLVGGDTLQGFSIPGLWAHSDIETILQHGIVSVIRSGSDSKKAVESHDLLSKMREKIILLDEECRNDVSSTAIRSLLRDKKSIMYLTPDPVVEYLQRTNLYTHSSENLNKDVELAPLTKGYK